MSRNVLLTDFDDNFIDDFIVSLSKETNLEWEEKKCVSNKARKNKLYN